MINFLSILSLVNLMAFKVIINDFLLIEYLLSQPINNRLISFDLSYFWL